MASCDQNSASCTNFLIISVREIEIEEGCRLQIYKQKISKDRPNFQKQLSLLRFSLPENCSGGRPWPYRSLDIDLRQKISQRYNNLDNNLIIKIKAN